ncbi:hypothetical protein ACHAPT_004015 [Fusarium lateritium]
MSWIDFLNMGSLEDFSKGKTQEEVFDQAYAMLDSLEASISRLRDLGAFADGIEDNPETKRLGSAPAVPAYATATYAMHVAVDDSLFRDHGCRHTSGLDKRLPPIARDVERDTERLEGYIKGALGALPNKIPWAGCRPVGSMCVDYLGLQDSSELPSLMASFDSKSEEEVKKHAQSAITHLEPLFERVKALALRHISHGEGVFFNRGLREFIDCGNYMAFLREYVAKSQPDGCVITKYMAGKLDRCITRVDRLMRAFLIAFGGLANEETPTGPDTPSLGDSYEGWSLKEILNRCAHDSDDLGRLLMEQSRLLTPRYQAAVCKLRDLLEEIDFDAILMRMKAMRTLRSEWIFGNQDYVTVVGEGFAKRVLKTLLGLLSADIEALRKFILDARVLLCSNSASEAPKTAQR